MPDPKIDFAFREVKDRHGAVSVELARLARQIPIDRTHRDLHLRVSSRCYWSNASALSMPRSSTSSASRRSVSARESWSVPISMAKKLSVWARAD